MAAPKRPLPPIITAALAQLMALGLLLGGMIDNSAEQGVAAALLGLALRLPWWWIPLNLLFPAALAYTHALSLPPWLFLIAFALLLLLNWNSAGERVPLYLSNRLTWDGISRLLPQRQRLSFVDLGSGLGGTLLYLARRHPECHFTGIESSPLPYAISWLRLHFSGLKNVELVYGDIWRYHLGDFNVVYAFLSPAPMGRLFEKLQHEMRNGAQLISNTFTVPDHPADDSVELEDRRRTRLYRWFF